MTVRACNIVMAGHDLKFARHLINHLQADSRYEVFIDDWAGITQTPDSRPSFADADLIFCEWAHRAAEWHSHHKLPHQKLVIRLHRFELDQQVVDSINWHAVDRLILVTPYREEEIQKRAPGLAGRTQVIRNMVDVSQFAARGEERHCWHHLGLLGYVPSRKQPHLAWRLLNHLLHQDDQFRLTLKGHLPWQEGYVWRRPEERRYYSDLYQQINGSPLRGGVSFSQWESSIAYWMHEMGVILSTSMDESCHLTIVEGVAAGCVPIVRHWLGAESQYPECFLHPFEENAFIESAAATILAAKDPGVREPLVSAAREHVSRTFDLPVILEQYDRMFAELVPIESHA